MSTLPNSKAIGVIDEMGQLKKAPDRKPWLSEKSDKDWSRWWRDHECYERIFLETALK